MLKTQGLHHISSMIGHAQKNIDFYSGVLGLRLVKQTLNFDDKSTYHLYYGNKNASTGLVTTFPYVEAEEGKVGGGQVGVSTLAVMPNSFEFWKERLAKFNIKSFEYKKFNEQRLGFKDLDGLEIDLVQRNDSAVND